MRRQEGRKKESISDEKLAACIWSVTLSNIFTVVILNECSESSLMDHKITLMNRARCGIVSGIRTLHFVKVEGITN